MCAWRYTNYCWVAALCPPGGGCAVWRKQLYVVDILMPWGSQTNKVNANPLILQQMKASQGVPIRTYIYISIIWWCAGGIIDERASINIDLLNLIRWYIYIYVLYRQTTTTGPPEVVTRVAVQKNALLERLEYSAVVYGTTWMMLYCWGAVPR